MGPRVSECNSVRIPFGRGSGHTSPDLAVVHALSEVIMSRRWLRRSVWVLLVLLGAVVLWDRGQVMLWVGRTDLTVVIEVTDAWTGSPISGATLELEEHPDGVFEEGVEGITSVTLQCDENGIARVERGEVRCVGKRSGLGWTDTFVVYPQLCRVRASAPKYTSGDWANLWEEPHRNETRRDGPGRSKLVIPVTLQLIEP